MAFPDARVVIQFPQHPIGSFLRKWKILVVDGKLVG